MAVKGSCMCGEVAYELAQAPQSLVVCHCIPCEKNAGPNGSVNTMVSKDKYKQLSGELRTWVRRKADSGKPVHYSVCKTCSTIMRVDAEAMPELVIVKPGTLDDIKGGLGQLPVVSEIYTRNRPDCFAALQAVKQVEGPPSG